MPLFDLLRYNATPLLGYQLLVSVFALYSLVNAAADWFAFRRPRTSPLPLDLRLGGGGLPGEPSVSVLIPARNEAAVIAACIVSLQAQDYGGALEIIVLDDRSDDHTGRIVAHIAASDSRVRLLSGGELLRGWKGKPNALRQMAAAATGDILLLTDADCVFYPGAVAGAVHLRIAMDADVLSLMPHLSCGSFWEHVIIPLQYVLVFATLPVRSVWASKNPAFAAANGAFILVSATTYADLGGHEPVKSEMAEDIRFAQHTKRQGRKLVYADGSTTYSVRMYHGFAETWHGFSKNVFSAMGNSVAVVAVWSVFLLLTQVLPFVFLVVALVTGDRTAAGFWLPLCHVVAALAVRAALTYRFRQAWWAVWTQPVGWLLVIAIAWNSAYLAISGRGHSWKGRTYTSAETPR